ncbi:hypothetical protein NW752_004445 [Fusarium irregulare]|uniref:Uncharacterized protein n=1 Tax=Fusarium irregulare TaxID=2494466 RepID=A0A9W8U976_9HYPO|nr:hypothetical protein NW766_007352 [Fusarium irregulare]KAJ4021437.1 hypothetical protein NW752_004445 [Fusarium irregulare]
MDEAQENTTLSEGLKVKNFWQLISSTMTIGSSPYEEVPERLFKAQPSVPIVGPLSTTLTVLPLAAVKKHLPAEHKPLLTFNEAQRFRIRGTDDEKVVKIAKSLERVLEQVMNLISQQGIVRWKNPELARLMSVEQYKDNPAMDVVWGLDIGLGQFSEHGLTTVSVEPLRLLFRKKNYKSLSARGKNGRSTWTLLEGEYLAAILSLSACSWAVLSDKRNPRITSSFPRRIVGHSSVEEMQEEVVKLERWLQIPGLKVEKALIQEREKDSEHPDTYGWRPAGDIWCLGMFLSSLSRYSTPELPPTI